MAAVQVVLTTLVVEVLVVLETQAHTIIPYLLKHTQLQLALAVQQEQVADMVTMVVVQHLTV